MMRMHGIIIAVSICLPLLLVTAGGAPAPPEVRAILPSPLELVVFETVRVVGADGPARFSSALQATRLDSGASRLESPNAPGRASTTGPAGEAEDLLPLVALAESVGVSDEALVVSPASLNLDESTGVSDSPHAIVPASRTVAESVNVSDSPLAVVPSLVVVGESIGVSDTDQVIRPTSLSVNENVGTSDSSEPVVPAQIGVSEYFGVFDSPGLAQSVAPACPGDANGDGVINVLDMTKVARIILQMDPSTPGADANQDGVVNVLDMTKIARIILQLDPHPCP